MKPQKVKPVEESEPTDFTASDVKNLAGLTYRQLNDWNEKKVFPAERENPNGWRRFGLREVLALAILAALRRELNVSLGKLENVHRWLLGGGAGRRGGGAKGPLDESDFQGLDGRVAPEKIFLANQEELHAASLALSTDPNALDRLEYGFFALKGLRNDPIGLAWLSARAGLPVYLYTNLSISDIFTEFQLAEAIANRSLPAGPVVIFPLNEIINRVRVRALKRPAFGLNTYSLPLATFWKKLGEKPAVSATELEVVKLIRERDYQQVTVHLKNGEIMHADMEENLAINQSDTAKREEAILRAISAKAYSTVTVITRGRKPFRLVRKSTRFFGKATEKS